MTTGQRIKEARKKAGMTQAELAEKLGVPYQSVSQWERGSRNPKDETIRRIADALDVDPWELSNSYDDVEKIVMTLAHYEALRNLIIKSENESPELKQFIQENFPDIPETAKALYNVTRQIYLSDGNSQLEVPDGIVSEMLSLLSYLNEIGQQKAVERVQELTEIPKYQRQDPPEDPTT